MQNKKKNLLDEENFKQEKKQTKINNPWEKVIQHIEIKETLYKGTNNVARMRENIIGRRDDYNRLKIGK